jgi:hypothetical protein
MKNGNAEDVDADEEKKRELWDLDMPHYISHLVCITKVCD